MTAFDAHRALLVRKDIFRPFHVTATRPLHDALAGGSSPRGKLRVDVPVVVTECSAVPVVLLKRQLAFHHVAQGEVAGEPWMVSF